MLLKRCTPEMFLFKSKFDINMKVITMSMLLASVTFAFSSFHKYTY